MDKGLTLEQVRGAVTRLRGAGIRIGFFLQFGYPGEGWPEIEKTRDLVRELTPDDIGISVSYPLPGTRFHDSVKARLGEKRNWTQSDDLDPLFPGLFSRDFYRRLSRTVHAEFRTRHALRTLRGLVADAGRGPIDVADLPEGPDRPGRAAVVAGQHRAAARASRLEQAKNRTWRVKKTVSDRRKEPAASSHTCPGQMRRIILCVVRRKRGDQP